jgi:hypothetical protein
LIAHRASPAGGGAFNHRLAGAWRREGLKMHQIVRHALHLGQGNLLRIEDGGGLLVSVTQGQVWLTEEGDSRDVVLESGQSFRLQHRGLSLVYALEPAGLTLSAPRSREYPEPMAVFSLVPSTLPV